MNERSTSSSNGLAGLLDGVGDLLGKLSDLAERARQAQEAPTAPGSSPGKGLHVDYGFKVSGLGGSTAGSPPRSPAPPQAASVPVAELREPLTDLFEEPEGLLVLLEMPGIEAGDVALDLNGDVLLVTAERGLKRYRKELLLPFAPAPEPTSLRAANGVVELRLARPPAGASA
jgi:HSP20 family protein